MTFGFCFIFPQVYYVPDVLKKAGITNEGTQLLANMGVGFVKVRAGAGQSLVSFPKHLSHPITPTELNLT